MRTNTTTSNALQAIDRSLSRYGDIPAFSDIGVLNAAPGVPFSAYDGGRSWIITISGAVEDYDRPSVLSAVRTASLVVLVGGLGNVFWGAMLATAQRGGRVLGIRADDIGDRSRWIDLVNAVNPNAQFLDIAPPAKAA